MSDYEKSEWKKEEFVKFYVDNAEGFVVERRRMISIMKSFYTRYIKENSEGPKVLDIGCGDGVLSRELSKVDRNIAFTLLDGSEKMLETAKMLMEKDIAAQYIKASFQDLMNQKDNNDTYDMIVSSLAIHHLTLEEKQKLYERFYEMLKKGGAFLNIDVVAAELEPWYLELWEDWVEEREQENPVTKSQKGISMIYKNNKDNIPDTLEIQLKALRDAGFQKVDCFYKYGIFAVFGGTKVE